MRGRRSFRPLALVILLTCSASSSLARSGEGTSFSSRDNLNRTQAVADEVRSYLEEHDILVAVLTRRGKITKPGRGISDVDKFDATGMAHAGFVLRTGFGSEKRYITLNAVRVVREHHDVSQLRAWSLEQFFVGSGEKDAMILVPERRQQVDLWNALLKDMHLETEEVIIEGQATNRQVIKGGLFARLHVKPYNLLSDFAFNQTQNCNEHLVKTLISVLHDHDSLAAASLDVELNFRPYDFRLSGFKKWMANQFMNLNIKGGERVVRGRNRFKVITVESMVSSANRDFLGIQAVQVFRETRSARGYRIEDWGGDYIKRNAVSGKRSKPHFSLLANG